MFHRLGPNLVVRSPWRPYRARPGERVLVLQGGGAFPPSHPTTRLCLHFLAQVLSSRSAVNFLDVGCGSGILALAAAAQGVSCSVGVDLCSRAARVSQLNARRNGLNSSIHPVRGSTDCLRGPFEVIGANLPVEVQLELAPDLDRLAAPQGILILSGFRDTREALVQEVYDALGWRRVRRETRDEWAIEVPPEGSFTWAGWILKREPD